MAIWRARRTVHNNALFVVVVVFITGSLTYPLSNSVELWNHELEGGIDA
jgi:hypothetical protein